MKNTEVVTAPLSMEQIKKFFDHRDTKFIIDYQKSQLKGSMLLTYISNLELDSDFSLEDVPKNELMDFIKDYMNSKSLIQSDILNALTAEIILTYKGLDASYIFEKPLLSREDLNFFITENNELLKKWDTFLTSSFYCCLSGIKEMEDQLKVKELFPTIEDRYYVGLNSVQLFSYPGFSETFMSAQPKNQIYYFKVQFEECIYKGKNFFSYFNHSNNLIAVTLEGLISGQIKMDQLIDAALPMKA